MGIGDTELGLGGSEERGRGDRSARFISRSDPSAEIEGVDDFGRCECGRHCGCGSTAIHKERGVKDLIFLLYKTLYDGGKEEIGEEREGRAEKTRGREMGWGEEELITKLSRGEREREAAKNENVGKGKATANKMSSVSHPTQPTLGLFALKSFFIKGEKNQLE